MRRFILISITPNAYQWDGLGWRQCFGIVICEECPFHKHSNTFPASPPQGLPIQNPYFFFLPSISVHKSLIEKIHFKEHFQDKSNSLSNNACCGSAVAELQTRNTQHSDGFCSSVVSLLHCKYLTGRQNNYAQINQRECLKSWHTIWTITTDCPNCS